MFRRKISDLEPIFKKVEQNIKAKVAPYPKDAPKIMILGVTGSGKSTLLCSLSHKRLTVKEGVGGKIILDGEGVVPGSRSGTKEPSIYYDQKNKIMFCDCPGFEDTDGFEQEIINSFSDDFLLVKNEVDVKIKILLVIQEAEFDASRGGLINKTLTRLEQMIPNESNSYELLSSIGIVITKCDEGHSGIDSFRQLLNRAKGDLKRWCEYFIVHPDQIFTFPRPTKSNAGKQYEFNDNYELIEFCKRDYLINPDHNLTLNNEALLELKNIRLNHLDRIKEIVTELFTKINEEYRASGETKTIGRWLDIMHNLLTQKISKVNDFKIVIKEYVPNCENFETYFKQLEEFEAFDSFIDRIYQIDTITSCLQDIFRNLTQTAIRELESNLLLAQANEIQEIQNQENEEKIRKLEDDRKMQKNQIDQLTKDIQNQQYINEQNKREYMEQMNRMTNEINDQRKEYETQINQMNQKYIEKQKIYEEEMNHMKEEFLNIQKMAQAEQNEYRARMEHLMEIIEKKDAILTDLANRPPVVVHDGGGGGCLLI